MKKEGGRESAPLFAVFRDEVRLMLTDCESCIPPVEQLKDMAKMGYKFKMRGVAYRPSARGKKRREN